MRWLAGRAGAFAPTRTGPRLALTALALMLSVGVSLALESSAVHILPLPITPAPILDEDAGTAVTAGADGPGAQQEQDDRNVPNEQQRTPEAVRQPRPLSRAQATALVQRRYRARVVRTHVLQDPRGQPLYEFRLLSSTGMVWTVRIDAQSGTEVP